MRPFELCFVVLTAVTAISVWIGRWPQVGRLLAAAALAVAVFHGMIEGARWQMIPAYAACALICPVAWKTSESKSQLRMITATLALLMTAGGMSLSLLLPMFTLPTPTGPYPIGTSILYFKDSKRIEDAGPIDGAARELMVQIWYPAEASQNHFARYREPRETDALSFYQSEILTNSRLDVPMAHMGAPFPVILFNHAWRGRRTNDTFLIEELASHGYVVASIDHTYNANLVAFPDGRVVHGIAPIDIDAPENSTAEHVRAIWDRELVKSVADQRFVLDRLDEMNRATGTPWFGRMDTNRAGAIGHSFGGAAATALCAEDPRVHGSVNMDGWFFDAIRERGPNQPLLVMEAYTNQVGEVSDAGGKVEANLDATDFADLESSLHRFGGYLVYVKGASHEDFTDQPLISPLRRLSHRGAIPAGRIQKIARTYVVAFFDKSLRGGDPEIFRTHSSLFSEVTLDTWPAITSGAISSIASNGQ